jgi:hypothetical protein
VKTDWTQKEELALELAIWKLRQMSREEKAHTFQQDNLKMSHSEVLDTLLGIRYGKEK